MTVRTPDRYEEKVKYSEITKDFSNPNKKGRHLLSSNKLMGNK